jgi:hypothetical protein
MGADNQCERGNGREAMAVIEPDPGGALARIGPLGTIRQFHLPGFTHQSQISPMWIPQQEADHRAFSVGLFCVLHKVDSLQGQRASRFSCGDSAEREASSPGEKPEEIEDRIKGR